MARLLSRTSITVDEAVSILLGRSTGPIDFAPIDDVEDNPEDVPAFDLRETLEDELEVLAGEHELAESEKRPADFIADKAAAVHRQEELIEQANLYLCEIQDELNKGECSVLKVDSSISNAAYTFITLHSFNAWRSRSPGQALDPETPRESDVMSLRRAKKKQPRMKLRDQENAIIDEIIGQRLNPLELPPSPPGRPGVKAAVRESLGGSPLFKGAKVFDKAWERLRNQRRIVDKT